MEEVACLYSTFLRTQIVKSSKWPSISAARSHFAVLFNLEININTKPTKTNISQSKFKSWEEIAAQLGMFSTYTTSKIIKISQKCRV